MPPLLWVMLAWLAGIAAILGSLMTLGSLLLWLVPLAQVNGKAESKANLSSSSQVWWARIRLSGLALVCAIAGLSLFRLIPFP